MKTCLLKWRFFCSILLVLSMASQTLAVDILVKASAREDYIRPVNDAGNTKAETYTFLKGKYYPYEYENPEDEIRFEEVAYALKQELTAKNYVMSKDPMKADFILVVHWGQTNSNPDVEYFDVAADSEDPFDPMAELDAYEADKQARENARIIGATSLYDMHVYSLKRQQLEEAARHDRYFVNVLALSVEEIRTRSEKEVMPKPLWTLQLSLPTGRAEPTEAFGTLAKTAGRYSGENLLNADFIREKEKRGIVRIGKLEFIETIDEATEAPKQ
ncbi:MAG: hypothetical protein GWO81_07950 [Verrucomicrobia bacterium]|nr:hypothetical protein [Verrucomicrobiota bacterium]